MADTDLGPTAQESSADPPAPASAHRRWILLAVAVAVLAVGAATVAIIADRDDSPSYRSAQIGWMHQGCQQWADSFEGADGPGDGWCRSMTDWMDDRMGRQRGGMMMGPMMWQDPASMRDTCRQWAADDAATADGSGPWCDHMVDWMRTHMGSWEHWMRNGPTMRGTQLVDPSG